MKVYFSGSHSSGKSTLARYVANTFNITLINETARMILSEQELNINELRCDLDIADKYQKQVFERQLIEEKKYNSFVSDRSAIDILAYTCQHSRIFARQLLSPELYEYVNGLRTPESIVFFVRPTKATLKADGVREFINWDGVIAIDAMIKLLLEMYSIRYYQINTDSIQERVRFIDSILNNQ